MITIASQCTETEREGREIPNVHEISQHWKITQRFLSLQPSLSGTVSPLAARPQWKQDVVAGRVWTVFQKIVIVLRCTSVRMEALLNVVYRACAKVFVVPIPTRTNSSCVLLTV